MALDASDNGLRVRELGPVAYEPIWRAMQRFTRERETHTWDEIWLLEHPPVFTLGLNAKREHVLEPGTIPLVPVDRGGQVTYHGPGQLVLYALLDLERRGLGVQALVHTLEQAVIGLLAEHGQRGEARRNAPGVYVGAAKLASLGLRIKRGGSYHGLALNVDMDLAPFARINPCGHPGTAMTQLRDLGIRMTTVQAGRALVALLAESLAYSQVVFEEGERLARA
jgi:lipoyl(octanoyl) transferase